MQFMRRMSATLGDERFSLSALVCVTGLVLTLQNPLAQESAAELLSKVEFPNLTQVLEMRPQSPPPLVEADQLLTDEGEEVRTIATTEREYARSGDPLRSRER
jgi:hypothetical protein